MYRKLALTLLVFLALGLLLTQMLNAWGSAGLSAGGAGEGVVRVAVQPGVFVTPFFLAQDQGYFRTEGLNVRVEWLLSGAEVNEALLSAAVDIAYQGITPAIIAASRDPGLRIIAISDLSNGGEGIVVRQGAGIRTLQDLRDKKVGVVLGSTAHRFLSEVLKSAGLEAGKDVAIHDMSVEDQMAAFRAGKIDAVAIWEPWKARALAAGGRALIDDSQAVVRTYDVIVARGEFLNKHPDLVEKFLRAHFRGVDLKNEEPEKAAEIVARYLDWEPSEVQETFKMFIHPGLEQQLAEDFFGEPTVKARKDIAQDINFLAGAGLIAAGDTPEVENLVDTSFLEKLGR